jgi:hypothetical protein
MAGNAKKSNRRRGALTKRQLFAELTNPSSVKEDRPHSSKATLGTVEVGAGGKFEVVRGLPRKTSEVKVDEAAKEIRVPPFTRDPIHAVPGRIADSGIKNPRSIARKDSQNENKSVYPRQMTGIGDKAKDRDAIQLREKFDPIVMDVGDAMAELAHELIPTIPQKEEKELQALLRVAQTHPPSDKDAFAATVNRIFDVFQLRIKVRGDEKLYRLRVMHGSDGHDHIQLRASGRDEKNGRGFKRTFIELVRVNEDFSRPGREPKIRE